MDQLTGTVPSLDNAAVTKEVHPRRIASKTPTLTTYSAKSGERNSTNLRSSFSRIEETAQFLNLDHESTLAMAIRHLDARTATWFMRQEMKGQQATTMEELRRSMFK